MGAINAQASALDQTAIYNFGVNLGIAFQLQDDILDLYANQDKFGKQLGGDILANKKTYLLLKAFEDASSTQLEELNSLLQQEAAAQKVERAVALFEDLHIREKAIGMVLRLKSSS